MTPITPLTHIVTEDERTMLREAGYDVRRDIHSGQWLAINPHSSFDPYSLETYEAAWFFQLRSYEGLQDITRNYTPAYQAKIEKWLLATGAVTQEQLDSWRK